MIEELALEANGLHFRCLAAGPADGEPVLMLHGFPEGAESWTPQLESLAADGLRGVAPDMRGYGGSDAPAEESAYRIAALIADAVGLLDALGWQTAHVAGHDWGSLVGWPLVAQHQDRVRTWTSLSIGHPYALAEAAKDEDQRRRSSYIRLFREPGGKAEQVLSEDGWRRLRAMYRIGPNPDAIPEPVVNAYVEGFARPGRMTAALNYYRAAITQIAEATAAPIRVPTALVWGEQDPAVGPIGAHGTERHVEGPYRFTALAGAGHWLRFERPAEVTDALLANIGRYERPT